MVHFLARLHDVLHLALSRQNWMIVQASQVPGMRLGRNFNASNGHESFFNDGIGDHINERDTSEKWRH